MTIINLSNELKMTSTLRSKIYYNKLEKEDSSLYKELGVEELDPKKILDELVKNEESDDPSNINDVIKFIKKDNLNNDELVSSLNRFIQKSDKNLQKFGAIYDKTGHSGIDNINSLPIDIVQRMILRAKSSAFLFVNFNLF